MILKIFTVYDQKVESYFPPFFERSKGAAIRAFEQSINDPSHTFAKYPQDYCLFELGEYDDQHATIDMHPAPVSLGLAIEFTKVDKPVKALGAPTV